MSLDPINGNNGEILLTDVDRYRVQALFYQIQAAKLEQSAIATKILELEREQSLLVLEIYERSGVERDQFKQYGIDIKHGRLVKTTGEG